LSGVLKHIKDLRGFLNTIAKLLDERGLLFAEQPDLTMFSKNIVEPFLEFSIEHINYFTMQSLQNLFSTVGLVVIDSKSKKAYLNSYDFIILAEKGNVQNRFKVDKDASHILKEYINSSTARLSPLEKMFHEWKLINKKIIVWGVGSFLMRLLATTELCNAKIVQFIDKNESMHGKRILGVEIVPPKKNG
jgi:hypothetical protein